MQNNYVLFILSDKLQNAISDEILDFRPSPGLHENPPDCQRFGANFETLARHGTRMGRRWSTCRGGKWQQDGRPASTRGSVPDNRKEVKSSQTFSSCNH